MDRKRIRLMIDCHPEFRFKLRALAFKNGMTMNDLVVHTLVTTYPELQWDDYDPKDAEARAQAELKAYRGSYD